MSNFIFTWATAALAAATLDLSTGNYYAHLVTTIPALAHTTVADLVLPTTNGYTSTPLTGLSYNSTRWTFDSFSFPQYSFASAPTGVVICKRTGATPAPTDSIICYSDFNNSIGQGITLTVGNYVVNLQFGSNGAINFSYRYQYNSGAFANTETFPKGLFYLLGTENNTIAFAPPSTSKLIQTGYLSDLTNRQPNTQNSVPGLTFTIDLQLFRAKIGKLGILCAYNILTDIEIAGSQDGTAFDSIYNATNISFTAGNYQIFVVNSSVFYKYLKVTAPNGNGFQEIELYDSSLLSPTINMT